MTPEQFEPIARRWLSTFQQDLKDFVHVVCDDPELDDSLRTAAGAAVLYALAPGDVIPDSAGPLGYVDDALALRIVLDNIGQRMGERLAAYGERLGVMVERLAEDIEASKAFLEDSYPAFEARFLNAPKVEFKGKRVADALNDPQWVDEEVSIAALRLDFKATDVNTSMKKLNTMPTVFRQKLLGRR